MVLIAAYSSTIVLQQHTCYVRSTAVINFAQGVGSTGGGINEDARIAHGVIMGVSFSVLLPLGIVIARFTKNIGPKTAWFYLHILCQTTTFIFIGAGCILGYTMVGTTQGYRHWITWHGPLGTVIWILVWIQYFSGWFRPDVKHKEKDNKLKKYVRIGWEWFHAWSGRIIFLMAAAQTVQGILTLYVPLWAFAIWAPIYAFWLIIGLILEILRIFSLLGEEREKD